MPMRQEHTSSPTRGGMAGFPLDVVLAVVAVVAVVAAVAIVSVVSFVVVEL